MHGYYELIIPPKLLTTGNVLITENQIVVVILQWDPKKLFRKIGGLKKLECNQNCILQSTKIAKKIEWSNQFWGIKTIQKY